MPKDMVQSIMDMYNCKMVTAYKIINNTISQGKIKRENKMFSLV